MAGEAQQHLDQTEIQTTVTEAWLVSEPTDFVVKKSNVHTYIYIYLGAFILLVTLLSEHLLFCQKSQCFILCVSLTELSSPGIISQINVCPGPSLPLVASSPIFPSSELAPGESSGCAASAEENGAEQGERGAQPSPSTACHPTATRM